MIAEKDFQQQVVDLARLLHWRVFHTFDSRRCEPGFPDLVLVRQPRLIVAELKTERGRLSRSQCAWLAAFSGVPGVEVWILRPSDWNRIEELLR